MTNEEIELLNQLADEAAAALENGDDEEAKKKIKEIKEHLPLPGTGSTGDIH